MHRVNKGSTSKGGKYLRCYGNAKGTCTNKLVRLSLSENVFREILAKVDSLSLIQDSAKALQQQLAASLGKSQEDQKRLDTLNAQILSVGELPPSLVKTMSELDQRLAKEISTQEQLKADIARESIVSRDDFFKRLDMVTFEGRAAANNLLKRLGLNTYIRVSSPTTAIFDISSEMPNEFKGKWPTMRFHMQTDSIVFEPFDDATLNAGLKQGDADMSQYDEP